MKYGEYSLNEYLELIKAPSTVEEDEAYFRNIQLHIELGTCSECGRDVHELGFRTEDEKREFFISGLCSDCQIKYFGK